jgi:hypothetical protein
MVTPYSEKLIYGLFNPYCAEMAQILRYLSPKEIGVLKMVNRAMKLRLSLYEHYTYSPNKILKRYFMTPGEFRAMQASTGTLISGSQALKLMGRFDWEAGDLDLYVWRSKVCEVCEWLVLSGYSFEGRASAMGLLFGDDYVERPEGGYQGSESHEDTQAALVSQHHTHVEDVYFFEKCRSGTEVLKIQVIIPEDTPIGVILKFHSSKKRLSQLTHHPDAAYSSSNELL